MIPKQLGCLGLPAKDRITGLQGIVTNIWFDLYGCVMVNLQPKINDKGDVPPLRYLDYTRLEFLSDTPVMESPKFSEPNVMPNQFKDLGRLGKEIVTEFKGICSSLGFNLSGCVFVTLTPPVKDDGTVPDNDVFDYHRVKFSGEPVMEVPDFSEEPVSPPDVTKKPHGPVVIERPKPL